MSIDPNPCHPTNNNNKEIANFRIKIQDWKSRIVIYTKPSLFFIRHVADDPPPANPLIQDVSRRAAGAIYGDDENLQAMRNEMTTRKICFLVNDWA